MKKQAARGEQMPEAVDRFMVAVVQEDRAAVLELIDRASFHPPPPLAPHDHKAYLVHSTEGLDVNERDAAGGWPLLAAVKCQNVAITQLPIDHGARPVAHKKRLKKQTELHALAEAQKGPFPPRPVPCNPTTTTRPTWHDADCTVPPPDTGNQRCKVAQRHHKVACPIISGEQALVAAAGRRRQCYGVRPLLLFD
jgi:hypothetical protein